MRGWGIKEIRVSSRGMYIRSTLDILPNRSDMRIIAGIPKLGEIELHV